MSEYMALYRKWRPSVFADVIGQDHITKVLCSEVVQGSVSHAYLFCGSRGTGKTTCAKILAKAVNCLDPQNGDPCGKCAACLAFDNSYDILEMDAASNNRVEDIRDLCEKVNFMPIELKKRVYIIDEVHMLTTGAFNALLKTLEEPPAHVMFILATTELNKIPATILSRCKRFDFHRISPEDMLPRLRFIADSEHIGITDDALRLIAFLATGAMRDALSMLELFVGKTDIDRDKAAAALGVVGNAPVLALLAAIAEKDSAAALTQLDTIYNASKDMGVLCSELAEMFRGLLIVKYASSAVSKLLDADPDVIKTLRDCEDAFTKERLLYSLEVTEQTQNKLARSGLSRRTVAELMVIKLCDPRMSTSAEAVLARMAELEAQIAAGAFAAPTGTKAGNTAQTPAPSASPPSALPSAQASLVHSAQNTEIPGEEIPLPEPPPESDGEPYPDEPPLPQAAPAANAPKADRVTAKSTGSPAGRPARAEEPPAVEMLAFAELLDELKAQNMIIYSMLSDAYAEICGDVVKIHVNPMGYLMLSDDKEKTAVIAAAASKLLGMPVRVAYVQAAAHASDSRPDLSGI